LSQQDQPAPSQDPRHQEDEIDLADLVAVLYRNRFLIVVATLLVTLAAVGYTLLQPKQFKATSFVEVGQTLVDGTYHNIEAPEAIKNRYKAEAQSLARSFEGNGQDNRPKFSPEKGLTVAAPENGNMLRIELTATEDSRALAFLQRVNQDLIKAHERVFSQKKAQIHNRIEQQKLAIQRVDNQISEKKRVFHLKKVDQKNKVARIQGEIANLKTRQETLREQLDLLKQEKADLEKRIEETQAQYDQLKDSKTAANQNASAQGAIGLMLFSNEVLQVQRYLEDLRTRSLFKIPERRAKFQAELKELGTQIQNKKAELDQARVKLSQLDGELKSAIEDLNAEKQEHRLTIQGFENQLANMITTQVTAEPAFSDKPVGPNLKLNAALGLVLGGFLSVFAAFLVEFWRANRNRIKNYDN
jgi:uncharacterized protein involved in exopolysaccharide biosynthesis